MFSATLDHLVVTAATVEDGAAHIQSAVGIATGPGGRHARLGTWNRLLSLGDCYMEAIAVDPEAGPPDHARWFGLDDRTGPPRLTHWAVAVSDLDAAVAAHPHAGDVLSFERNGLRWRMAVPPDGRYAFDDLFPALLQWETDPPSLPPSGARLASLTLSHPDAPALAAELGALLDDPRVAAREGEARLSARIDTPDGPRDL
ncbi:VOC family protein [Jannaschia sp. Os4]|uniref:VOC family protein n=1 Tax=Jannaschia sp. Os4 TaxID=2807617 RepID=UPI001939949E|nr:VOC family protein [Jannaschia sp. Os4]MBM2577267.1 VOC family protein [Jannaschia sp. Os4]